MKENVGVASMLILVAGCISGEEETPESTKKPGTPPQPTTTGAPPTTAPTTAAPGTGKELGEIIEPIYENRMWSAYTVTTEGEKVDMSRKFFDDTDIYISEMEMVAQGMNIAVQIWYREGKTFCEGEQLKMVMQMGGITYCVPSISQENMEQYSEVQYEPEEYDTYTVVRETTYTTPSGKTVTVVVVKDEENEWWFSNEVPFSVVRVVTEGNETLILTDFGFDARRTISREDGENCVPMVTP